MKQTLLQKNKWEIRVKQMQVLSNYKENLNYLIKQHNRKHNVLTDLIKILNNSTIGISEKSLFVNMISLALNDNGFPEEAQGMMEDFLKNNDGK